MRILKLAAAIVLLIGFAYLAYGAFALSFASMDEGHLTPEITQKIYATGATWEEWRKSFYRGGIWVMGLGAVAVIAGVGMMRKKVWARTIWLFLSPILLLSQFSEGQKSVTFFKTQSGYRLAFLLLIVVGMSWLLLLLPSSRKALAREGSRTQCL